MTRRVTLLTALAAALMAAGQPPSGAAAAPFVAIEAQSHGAGDSVILTVVVSTSPNRKCWLSLKAGKHRRNKIKALTTSGSGGGKWQAEVIRGVKAARWTARVTCRVVRDGSRTAKSDPYSFSVPRGLAPGSPRRLIVDASIKTDKIPGFGDGGPGAGGGAEWGWPEGECTEYVARLRPDLPYFEGRAGDAKNWLAAARAELIPVGAVPVAGAVAVFKPGQFGAGKYGHVAYVEAVDGDHITISERNRLGDGKKSTRTIRWADSRLGFIYGGKAGSGPKPAGPGSDERHEGGPTPDPGGTGPILKPSVTRHVMHYECPSAVTKQGRTLNPGQWWGHPFVTRGTEVRSGTILAAAPNDGSSHQAIVGVYTDQNRSAPLAESQITIPVGGTGVTFTFNTPAPVTAGRRLWLTIKAIDELVVYDQSASTQACMIGSLEGTGPSSQPDSPGRTLIVDSRVTNGPSMREDLNPVQLLDRPAATCTTPCAIPNTARTTGGFIDDVYCQTFGPRVTNGDDTSSADDENPELAESRWYYGARINGITGYVSEVWVRPADRGGLGLPIC